MAKEATAENLSPLAVSVGAIAAATAAKRAAALLSYVAGRRPHVHLAIGAAVLGGIERPPVDLYFPASGSVVRLRTRIRIGVDVVSLTIGVRCVFTIGGNAGQVIVRVNGVATTISASSANNGTEQTATVATSLVGTGWQDLEVELTRTSGSGTAYVRNLSVQDTPITDPTTLPDPTND